MTLNRRHPGLLALLLLAALLPTAFSGDSIIQHVHDGTNVDVGFDAAEPGPHDLTLTLQANGSATTIYYSWVNDPNGTIVWTNSNNTSAFEHHWTANGVHGYDVTTPSFGGYTNDPADPWMMYGVFQVKVSHLDMDLDDLSGDPPPWPGQPDPKDEAEADTGVSMPITYDGDILPGTFPLSDTTGRALSVNIISGQGGTLVFDGTGPELAVYQQGVSAWEKVTAGLPVSAGSYSAGFRVHTSNWFTGPVMLKARLQHATSALDAADEVKIVYAPPSALTGITVSTVMNGTTEYFVNGDTIYIKKGPPGSTLTLTAIPDPETESFPPGDPTWAGGTPGSTTLDVPIDQASATSAGTPYTVSSGEISTTVNVVVASVAITTTGDLKIVQDPDEKQITLTGFVQPPDLAVTWQLSPTAPQIVSKTDTFNPASGQTTTTITLDKTAAGWGGWNSLTSSLNVSLIATNAQAGSLLDDTTTVTAYKFARNGQYSPGSQNVVITLPFQGTGIGHTFRTPDPNNPNDNGLNISASTSKFINQTIDAISGVGTKSQDWKFFYFSNSDVGDGSYSISENVSYVTNLNVSATYDGWGHNATIAAASAGSGGVDNNAVNDAFAKLGIGYTGHPISVSIGISTDGESSTVGVSVSATLSEQDEIQDGKQVNASYQLQLSAVHVSQTQINRTSTVKCAAGVNVTQNDDDEWYLSAFSTVSASVPASPKISFTPDF